MIRILMKLRKVIILMENSMN